MVVWKKLNSNAPDPECILAEELILAEIKKIVVKEKNKAVYIKDFIKEEQQVDESIYNFFSRLKDFFSRLKDKSYNCDLKH